MPTHSASPDHSAYDQTVRRELSAFLRGDQAHASLDAAVKNMPASLLDKKPAGSPHNAWQMLEHIRIALHDLLEFCTNPKYEAPTLARGILAERRIAEIFHGLGSLRRRDSQGSEGPR